MKNQLQKKTQSIFQVDFEFKDIFVNIFFKDVTALVGMQQDISDKIYQDAIELNYSHEQNTPLNCILNNSQLIKKELKTLSSPKDYSRAHYKKML